MSLLGNIDNFIYNPRKIMFLALLFSVVMMAIYALFCIEMYRDVAGCYAYMAREFGRCNWNEAFNPNLPPMNIVFAGLLAMLGVEAYTATIIVSGAFYILTIFPLYVLLKRFLKPHEAAWGVLLFVIAPKIIRFSGTGLLESARNFFLVLALMLLFKSLDSRKWQHWAWLGAALAGLAMSRGEGFVIVFIIIGINICLLWRQEKYSINFNSIRRIAGTILLIVFVILILLSPRLYQNYKITRYPVIDGRMVDFAKIFTRTATKQVHNKNESVSENKISTARRFLNLLQGFSRGAYEIYLILAVGGLLIVLPRREWRYEYTVFFIIIAVHLLLYFEVVSAYRYHTFALPLLMPFTVVAFVYVLNWIKSYKIEKFFMIVLPIMLIAQIVNGMEMSFSKKDLIYKEIAGWINTNKNIFAHNPGQNRLKIIFTNFPEVCFWGDMIPVGLANDVDLRTTTNFDVIIVSATSKSYLDAIRSRHDIEKVLPPFSNEKLLIFRKK